MKIAVVGKGGVGKTLVAGTLARYFAKDFEVLAIDNDPSMNLIYSLGMDPSLRDKIIPISEMDKLVEERTMISGADSGIYNANPHVSDIPDKFKIRGPDNLQILVLGTIDNPSTGCLCSANVLVRTILADLILNRNEVVIIDFEAGLEHLGRGTAKGIDTMLIVTGPYRKSLDLSEKILKLSRKMNIKKNFLIGNMVTGDKSTSIIQKWAEKNDIEIIGMVPHDPQIADCELDGRTPYDSIPNSNGMKELKNIHRKLKSHFINSE